MKKYTYNFEIKDLLTQFVAAFDDVVIKRYNKDRVERESINVRYVVAPKQRVMYDIVNKAQNITLPVVAINVNSITRDPSRVFNKNDSIYNYVSENSNRAILTPVPINISVSMSILARYMEDMDQILSNFVAYTNPYIIIAWKEPSEYTEDAFEIRTEVLWDGNISMTTPTDTTYTDKFRIIADTTFTIKGWIFKNGNVDAGPPIYFIEQNFSAPSLISSIDSLSSAELYRNFKTEIASSTETVAISAIPKIDNIYYNYKLQTSNNIPPLTGNIIDIPSNLSVTYNKQLTGSNNFILLGDNFNYTTNVLLSSSNPNILTNFVTISSKYSGVVSGFKLPINCYTILSNNTLSITLPNLSSNISSQSNIIVVNDAGWTSTTSVSGFYIKVY